MREDQQQFMRLLGQLPARLTAEQAAWVLNCQPHDVPILVGVRLLKPLAIRHRRASSILPRRNCWNRSKIACGWPKSRMR